MPKSAKNSITCLYRGHFVRSDICKYIINKSNLNSEGTNKHKWWNKPSHVTNKDWQPWQICQPYICPFGSKIVFGFSFPLLYLIFLLLASTPLSFFSVGSLSLSAPHLLHQKGSLSSISRLICTAFWKSLHLAMTKLNHFTCRAFQHLHKTTKITWMMKHTVSSTVAGVMQMHHFHHIWQMTQLYK